MKEEKMDTKKELEELNTPESYKLPKMPEVLLPESGSEDKVEEFGISRVGD